jgi:hypothetical protein
MTLRRTALLHPLAFLQPVLAMIQAPGVRRTTTGAVLESLRPQARRMISASLLRSPGKCQ